MRACILLLAKHPIYTYIKNLLYSILRTHTCLIISRFRFIRRIRRQTYTCIPLIRTYYVRVVPTYACTYARMPDRGQLIPPALQFSRRPHCLQQLSAGRVRPADAGMCQPFHAEHGSHRELFPKLRTTTDDLQLERWLQGRGRLPLLLTAAG